MEPVKRARRESAEEWAFRLSPVDLLLNGCTGTVIVGPSGSKVVVKFPNFAKSRFPESDLGAIRVWREGQVGLLGLSLHSSVSLKLPFTSTQ